MKKAQEQKWLHSMEDCLGERRQRGGIRDSLGAKAACPPFVPPSLLAAPGLCCTESVRASRAQPLGLTGL